MENHDDTASTTVNQVLDLYRQDCFEALSPRTRKDYVRHIALLRDRWGERCVDGMRPKEFGAFIHERKDGKVQRVRQLAVLSSAFTQAVCVYGIIARNPLRDVRRPKFKPRDRLVSEEEYATCRALGTEPIQIGMDLAVKTGQREGDILNFRWEDLKEQWVLREDATGKKGFVWMWVLEVCQGKTGKRLGIPVDAELEAILDRCYQRRKYKNPFVLGSRNGRAYSPEGFRATWQRTMQKFMARGGKNFHFHDLRALCATRCRTLEEAQALLGHDSPVITKRVYDRGIRVVACLPAMPGTPHAADTA